MNMGKVLYEFKDTFSEYGIAGWLTGDSDSESERAESEPGVWV